MVLLMLSGCSGTKSLATAKLQDYTKTPQNIVGAQVGTGTPIKPSFKTDLTALMTKCGTSLQFPPAVNKDVIKASNADAILTIKEIGHETGARLLNGVPTGKVWINKIRYEFALVDTATNKIVWKGQDDFGLGEPSPLNDALNGDPAGDWAKTLIEQMQKDGIVGKCGG